MGQGEENPSQRHAMQPIANTSEDQATDAGNMQKNFVKIVRVVLEISSRTDRQADRHTHHNTLQLLPWAK